MYGVCGRMCDRTPDKEGHMEDDDRMKKSIADMIDNAEGQKLRIAYITLCEILKK